MLMLLLVFQITNAQSNLRGPASTHLLAETLPYVEGTFSECKYKAKQVKAGLIFNTLDDCMRKVVADWELKNGNPRECLETARLVKSQESISLLSKICTTGIMYYLCKVEESNQSSLGQLDCLARYSDDMNNKDCKPERTALKAQEKELLKLKLTSKQRLVLIDDLYCERSKSLPPGLTQPAPGQQR